MDKTQIRLINSRFLANSSGGQAAFASKVGMSESQVNQIIGKNPKRGIGSKVAQRIEEAFCKPLGWIDTDHDAIRLAGNSTDFEVFESQAAHPLMHEFVSRLYEFASLNTEAKNPASVARLLNISPQVLKNWELRGISAEGAINAELVTGCSALWIYTGKVPSGLLEMQQSGDLRKLDNLILQILRTSGISCQRVTRDTALPDELKISEDRLFRPELVCELEGVRVFVEVMPLGKPDVYELFQRQIPALVIITPQTVDRSAETVRARVREIKANKGKLDLIAAFRTMYEQMRP